MFKDIQATIQINLEKSLEELWNNLDKDARWGVKKAKRENLQIKIIGDEKEIWKIFYKLYVKTITEGGIVPKSLDDLEQETNKLFICLKNNNMIAGAAIKIKSKTVELFLNASSYDYLKYQPNNLLYWSIIVWAKKNNFKLFDLGGYQINAEKQSKLWYINRFKERWGGKIIAYEISSKNPFYILGRKVIRNLHFIKNWRDKIKLNKWKKQNQ
jgi:lipid II:glycine glycyltransferase (peptidoglycan interpeptide bridge formation enzyme)